MGNLCCAREYSVQVFVQFFYAVKLQSLIRVYGTLIMDLGQFLTRTDLTRLEYL